MTNYIHLLVLVVHPLYGMRLSRYCLSVSLDDPRMSNFDIRYWAEPKHRQTISSLLCKDWEPSECVIVGCDKIDGAIDYR